MSFDGVFYIALGIWAFFTLFYAIAYFKNDLSFIDIGWGIGFCVLILLVYGTGAVEFTMDKWLQALLVFIWCLRLSLYLYLRNKDKGEDRRYQELARQWRGNKWVNAYFRVYMIQALLLMIVGVPLILEIKYESSLTLYGGVLLAFFGLMIESFADWQLSQFIKQPQKPSKFCRIGLWKNSRHPNYFGEILFWFGIATICANPLAFVGPIFLTFLLLKVSGVPMIEDRYSNHPEWQKYYSETRLLIPIPKQG